MVPPQFTGNLHFRPHRDHFASHRFNGRTRFSLLAVINSFSELLRKVIHNWEAPACTIRRLSEALIPIITVFPSSHIEMILNQRGYFCQRNQKFSQLFITEHAVSGNLCGLSRTSCLSLCVSFCFFEEIQILKKVSYSR